MLANTALQEYTKKNINIHKFITIAKYNLHKCFKISVQNYMFRVHARIL